MMNLLNLFRPHSIKLGSDFTPILGYERLQGSRGNPDTIDTHKAYILGVTSSWVYSAVKLIADRISQIDLEFRQDGNIVKDFPLSLLLTKPNSLMAGSFLTRYLIWWYLLRGNAYLFLSTPNVGVAPVREIWPLVAENVRPMPESLRSGVGLFAGKQILDYEYNVAGRLEVLPGENVVHFRTPNPFDWWEGLSPLVGAMLPLQTDEAQIKWQRDFFAEDNAIPTSVISFPSTTSPTDFERQRSIISEQMASGQRRIFTRAGDLKIETVTQTLEQMQILENRKFTREQIDRVFGIPDGIFTGSQSQDSRLAAEISFSRNTIQPLLDYLAEQLNSDFAVYAEQPVTIVAPNIVPQDKALQVQEYSIYSQDRTVSENRKELGLEEITLPEHSNLLNVPVRLLQWLAPISAKPAEAVPKVGSTLGALAPEALVDGNASKAVQDELRKWKAVCVKRLKEGKEPKEFKSETIPEEMYYAIWNALQEAKTEMEVKTVFETVPFRLFYP